MKKNILAILIVIMLICLVSCKFTSKVTKSTTTTTTDAQGNSVTETTQTVKEKDSESASNSKEIYQKSIPLNIKNNTDFDWYQIFIKSSDKAEYGNNLITDSTVIKPGETASGVSVSFYQDTRFDLIVADQKGHGQEFKEMNFMEEGIKDHIFISVDYDKTEKIYRWKFF